MGKSFEVKTIDNIPWPKTVRKALLSYPDGYGYVSHTLHSSTAKVLQKRGKGAKISEQIKLMPCKYSLVENGEKYLTGDNHAFYIGKFFPRSNLSMFMESVFEWRANESFPPASNNQDESENDVHGHIYSEEVIQSTLKYMFAHLKPGEKANIVVGPCLSELINGPDDLRGALTADKEIEMIHGLAATEFAENKDYNLQTEKMDELPLHLVLFESLKTHRDLVTGKSDVAAALSVPEAEWHEGEPNSLQIAAILLKAANSSPDLASTLDRTVPKRLQIDADRETLQNARNYGIVEIAIRLAEILNGRNIHIGVERQAVYDDIIVEILKGSQGRFAKIELLNPLLKQCVGLPFETLHVDNKHNPNVLDGIRDRARSRLFMLGLWGTTLVASGLSIAMEQKNEVQASIATIVDNNLAGKLKNVQFPRDRNATIDKSENVEIFHKINNRMLKLLGLRYGISDSELGLLKPHTIDFLLSKMPVLPALNNDPAELLRATDEFVMIKKHVMLVQGIFVGEPDENADLRLAYTDPEKGLQKGSEEYAYLEWMKTAGPPRTAIQMHGLSLAYTAGHGFGGKTNSGAPL